MIDQARMFASVFQHAALGMVVSTLDGRYLAVNAAMCQMLGYSAEEIQALSFRGLTHPDDLHDDLNRLLALNSGALETMQVSKRYLHRSGRVVRAQITVTVITEHGVPAYYVNQVQDVTDRHDREEQLRVLEERWKFALEGSREGVWDWFPQSGQLYLSARWKEILGYAEDDFEATPAAWLAQVHPDDRPALLPLYERHAAGETHSYEYEHRMRHRDGRWRWVLLRGRISARDEQGQPLRVTGTLKDIDGRVHAQQELARARRHLQGILDNLPAMVGYWDAQGRNRFGNAAYLDWFGHHPDTLRGRHISDIIGAELYALNRRHIEGALAGERQHFEREIVDASGCPRYTQATYVPDIQDGEVQGFFALISDITARRTAELEVIEQREWAQTTLNSIGDAVITTDPAGQVTFMNPVAEELTGWNRAQAQGLAIERVMDLRDAACEQPALNPLRLALQERRVVGMELDATLKAAGGQSYSIADSAAPIVGADGRLLGAVVVFHNVSEARAMAVRMSHLAQHDALTELPNRVLLHDRTQQALAHHRRHATPFAVVFMDLDHFKHINDTLGHQAGDRLLQLVSTRLGRLLRETDTVSRQGGDEFVLLLAEVQDNHAVRRIIDRVVTALAEPYDLDGQLLTVTFSIGIALCPDDGQDVDTLMKHADAAMYVAKREGRNRSHFFSAEILHAIEARHHLEQRLRRALKNQEFRLHFQPRIDAERRSLTGLEALVRWQVPGEPLIAPGAFIPVAEETGLIVPLGEWVLETACHQARSWLDGLGVAIPVSVNIASPQFAHPDFVAHVERTLSASRLPPHLLELEITESMLIGNAAQARDRLQTLKALGVRLSIDDFGTGYSSLSYLKLLPVDTLKIDRSFVRDLTTDHNDLAIVSAVIGIAGALGLQVMAEGVETAEQAQALIGLGCRGMQGFYFARPMPSEDVPSWLRGWAPAILVPMLGAE
ncbi:sensor domain-containing protein [Deinococcus koreensis]|uniref:GGDEF domain-containing protein n=1 Tax=Deinococcus koreensis TaxID=2054903 RepID=A0A2K3URU1_9DEIO|nr:EAL domain-containing protein [Deinococcus koreensis]PNY79261.1 hypothetical protein CVO96_20325 [Deinococcus koreensis]